jgi:hypothetical protein
VFLLTDFNRMLKESVPFSFIRFSDGETEVLRNNYLELSPSGVTWSKGRSAHVYPEYDHKRFDPSAQRGIRDLLIASARYSAENFYKGIPARHNKDPDATRMLRELNGNSENGLTFADLLINSNYKGFLRSSLPILLAREKVTVVGNFRMRPDLVSPNWPLLAIPDNAFDNFQNNVDSALNALSKLEGGSVVLSSASSMSNVVGWQLHLRRPDITFIDIGTALHPQMGMGGAIREYHTQLLRWNAKSAKAKLAYALLGRSRLKW